MSEGGDERNGVVLLGLLVDSRPAPSTSPTEHVISYVDGATQTYDTATHELTWKGVEGGSVKIIGESKIELIGKDSIEATSEDGFVNISGKESITAESEGPVAITGKVSVTVTSEGFVTITGPENVTINGPAGIFLNGPTTISETLKVVGIGTFMTDVHVGGDISADGEGDGVGNVRIKGNLIAGGDVSDRTSTMQVIRVTYNGHNHNCPDGSTETPNQPM